MSRRRRFWIAAIVLVGAGVASYFTVGPWYRDGRDRARAYAQEWHDASDLRDALKQHARQNGGALPARWEQLVDGGYFGLHRVPDRSRFRIAFGLRWEDVQTCDSAETVQDQHGDALLLLEPAQASLVLNSGQFYRQISWEIAQAMREGARAASQPAVSGRSGT